MPFLTRTLAPFEVLSDEGLSIAVEENADTILEQVGIDFRDAPDAIELLRDAGAEIDGERVRIPRGMCRQLVQATAPSEFTQVARNPERSVIVRRTSGRSSRPRTARPSSATSTAAVATARSRTSATS